jgi:ESS family glutamate:Na+ symporter
MLKPFIALCMLLAIGKLIRVKVKFVQKLYLPSAIVAGVLGLISVQTLNHLGFQKNVAEWTSGWGSIPGFLINIVFAALFLGVKIPSLKKVWKKAGPQLAYGQIVVWGQYMVGLGLTIMFISKFFSMPNLFGVIIPVGFEGGHGTAGGLKQVFEHYNWSQGTDFALASATFGIISAIIIGMIIINIAIAKGWVKNLKTHAELSAEESAGIYPENKRPSAGLQTVSPDSVDTMALHLSILGLAIFVGYILKSGLVYIEGMVPVLEHYKVFTGFPLFPLAMIGGLVVQSLLNVFSKNENSIVDKLLMDRWAGTALDFLVIAAISTIRIETISKGLVPFLILVTFGVLWNIFCVVFLAKRMLPADSWFERSIAEMGQSMGVTATGLLLLRAVDPNNETDAAEAFAYKQLLHEPFMGGGIWTSTAIPLIMIIGGVPVLMISVAAIIIWFIVWNFMFKGKI